MSVWAPVGHSSRYGIPFFLETLRRTSNCQIRKLSRLEALEKRNRLFALEKKRQIDSVGRIEKIEVRYLGVPKDITLLMNKDISTPFDCAKHMSANHIRKSALALIDGTHLWDMHRPLTNSCSLEFLHFMMNDPTKLNTVFWRTCSFALGMVASKSFKDKFEVNLHSFPSPDVRSGSFVYDIELRGLEDWVPQHDHYRVLGLEMVRLAQANIPIERLCVSRDLALEMFEDNEFKSSQIPSIAQKYEGQVTLYKAGDHIDISKGPMVGNLNQIGRLSISSIHKITGIENGKELVLHRFQGVAIPTGFQINHMAFDILANRAKNLNPARLPFGSNYIKNDELQEARVSAS